MSITTSRPSRACAATDSYSAANRIGMWASTQGFTCPISVNGRSPTPGWREGGVDALWASMPMCIQTPGTPCCTARARVDLPARDAPFRITICPVLTTRAASHAGGYLRQAPSRPRQYRRGRDAAEFDVDEDRLIGPSVCHRVVMGYRPRSVKPSLAEKGTYTCTRPDMQLVEVSGLVFAQRRAGSAGRSARSVANRKAQ